MAYSVPLHCGHQQFLSVSPHGKRNESTFYPLIQICSFLKISNMEKKCHWPHLEFMLMQQFKFIAPFQFLRKWGLRTYMEIKEIRALSTLEFLVIYTRYIHFLLLKALIFLFGKVFNRILCMYNIAQILSAI